MKIVLSSVLRVSCGLAFSTVFLFNTAFAAICHTETRCAQKQVCRFVCSVAGGAVGGAVAGGVGTGAAVAAGNQVCSQLCEFVPDCVTQYACDQYVAPGESFFLLPSEGDDELSQEFVKEI